VFSYFAEVGISIVLRTYVGPVVEKLELLTQKIAIKLSQRYKFVENMFRHVLRR
jgi:hypothetical protein